LTDAARILGIDYGRRRIGVAISDPDGVVAVPVRIVEVRSDKGAAAEVRQICEETGVGKVVLGLPVNMDGTEGPAATGVRAFAERLEKALGLPVELWDERLSTRMAERALQEAEVPGRKRKTFRDKLAAQLILQGYLDSRCSS
jgi:putative Holliday junction resolvase